MHCKPISVIIHSSFNGNAPEATVEEKTVKIPSEFADQRLDVVLAQLMPDYSRTEIKSWINDGRIHMNHLQVKAKTKVKGGEIVIIEIHPKPPAIWQAQAIPLNIVYEDETILIINKPVGLVVHPGAGTYDQTLLNALLHHAPQLQSLPRAGIVHRLDKNTSGLLVIAKTPQAIKHLINQLKKRQVIREYLAVVYGKMISGGVIDAPIGRNPLDRKRMAVVDTGKPAITHYRIKEKYPAHTLLSIRLETGRTHQIRVHMSYIHHPIVGDLSYGGRVKLSKNMNENLIHMLRHFKRQALHAQALTLTHPQTSELLHFEADLPEDMQQLIKALQE